MDTRLPVDTSRCHFFYGGIFSQWYRSNFIFNDIMFNTAEQFMMYAKAKVFYDHESASEIMKTSEPSRQKQLGREVKNYEDDIWLHYSYNIVLLGNFLKFTQDSNLHDQMSALSYPDLFVEASPYDKRWGIGLGLGDPNLMDHSKWDGDNMLGEVVTDIRDMICGKGKLSLFKDLENASLIVQGLRSAI